ncbi:MAG TPA: hypothetical protein VJN72_03265 [Gaiellales bacterium]|nr:hypothetical protein [Gaiellales bacterium]
MTADPAGILRLLEAPAEPEPTAARPLRLISALSAHGRVARAEGLAGAGAGHELRLPGIGGRYLAGLAAHAHEQGWHAPEVAALLDAVEDRSSMWIVTPSAASLRRAGLIESGGSRRAACARWSAGRWRQAPVDPDSLARVGAAGRARAVCIAAVSGTGAPRKLVSAMGAEGVELGWLDGGLATSLRVAWTVELLVAPALPAGSLMALRERIASAPRCSWCGVPMVGADCTRCLPGAPA